MCGGGGAGREEAAGGRLVGLDEVGALAGRCALCMGRPSPHAPPLPIHLLGAQIRERNTQTVKNYGISIKYNSRSGTHNMYKEYRATSLCSAVEAMYADLAGLHRARFRSIHIVDTFVVPSGKKAMNKYNPEVDGDVPPPHVVRLPIKQLLKSHLKFPVTKAIPRPSSKDVRSVFVAKRPATRVN